MLTLLHWHSSVCPQSTLVSFLMLPALWQLKCVHTEDAIIRTLMPSYTGPSGVNLFYPRWVFCSSGCPGSTRWPMESSSGSNRRRWRVQVTTSNTPSKHFSSLKGGRSQSTTGGVSPPHSYKAFRQNQLCFNSPFGFVYPTLNFLDLR